ncbi:DUF1801 domain-containing protein [Jiangella rhizosphaerae]|uniref:DUF1801 domain-containing protein n=1 Tax=Jiangella rhizosphaerae TaxID=2293569 RepID=A0A418KWR1_9ACTN|nr:DUF1801 domain-containing protein [Jiangella rhizosphaerae]RIQ35929.1 DUF1801 domain-containing protein [Jiangella rhizosphaerae]
MTGRPHQIDLWLDQLPAERRTETEALADQLRDAAPGDLDEAIKWNRLTFTAGGDWHHWICAVAVNKQTVSLMFHKGVLLDDPDDLLDGGGRYLRTMPFTRAREHPAAVAALLRQALDRQRDMLPR